MECQIWNTDPKKDTVSTLMPLVINIKVIRRNKDAMFTLKTLVIRTVADIGCFT